MAHWSDEIELVELIIDDSGEDGIDRETEGNRTTIFADRASATRSEFYAAASIGANADIAFKVRKADYAGQKKLYWNGQAFRVLRDYELDDNDIQLVCSDFARKIRLPMR